MEQLGYIALGCVLILVVLGLRRISIALAIHSVDRVDWSKIRLPKRGSLSPSLSVQLIGRGSWHGHPERRIRCY